METNISGKVILITGGNSGIGRETAVLFAERGAKVVIAARRVQEGERTVDEIGSKGGEAFFVQTDVSSSKEVSRLVEKTVERFGRLDYAFNNAGGSAKTSAPIDSYPEDSWNKVINVNLTGVWLCMKYEIRQMLENGGGAIVNNSSVFGFRGYQHGKADYVAAKHGVVGLTRAAALEYAEKGIRVNAVCPAWVQTPRLTQYMQDDPRLVSFVDEIPVRRMGKPEDVAEAVVWLCSPASSFITGHMLVIDGGSTAG